MAFSALKLHPTLVRGVDKLGFQRPSPIQSEEVRNIILSRGMLLAGLGTVLGLAGSVALGRVLGSLLFGVTAVDLPTLVGASMAFLCVAAVSSIIPATRAARSSPAIALRAEG